MENVQYSEVADEKKDESEKIAGNTCDENEVKSSDCENNVSGSQIEKYAKPLDKPSKKREVGFFLHFLIKALQEKFKIFSHKNIKNQLMLMLTCFHFLHLKRYQVNLYEENCGIHDEEEDESAYTYFIRPYIPFWSLQSLRFEDVNSYNEIPAQREGKYPRYVMEKLVRTWLRKDKTWFDQKEIFDILEEDIIAMLDSIMPPKKKLRENNYSIFLSV